VPLHLSLSLSLSLSLTVRFGSIGKRSRSRISGGGGKSGFDGDELAIGDKEGWGDRSVVEGTTT